MRWIVAYDIADDRRRGRIHRFLKAEGIGTQKSVFVCDLTAARLRVLVAGLEDRIEPEEDQVRLYPLCRSCSSRTAYIGARAELEDHGGFLVT